MPEPKQLTQPEAAVLAWRALLRMGLASRKLAVAFCDTFEGTRDEWDQALTPVKKTSGFEYLVSEAVVRFDLVP